MLAKLRKFLVNRNIAKTQEIEALKERIQRLEETNLTILRKLIQMNQPPAKSTPSQSKKPAKMVIVKKSSQEQGSDRLSLLDPHKEPTFH